jgi:alpha-L-rhamnosidase
VHLIEQAGDHLGTGFLSTPMLLQTLTENGRADVAFRLLLQTTNPSWLYQVERGATTVWETWAGHDNDGNAMASHNHYAFGAVAAFLVEGIAGLSPAAPGYRKILVKPIIGGGLTHASASVDTPFGKARSAWRLSEGEVRLNVLVPPGAEAEIVLGDGQTHAATSGEHQFVWKHCA